MTNLVRDENRVAALGGESTLTREILPAKINATSNRLLTESQLVSSSGTTIDPATADNQTNGSQKTYDEGNNLLLREVLEQLTLPIWYTAVSNALQVVLMSGTITTVSTLSNQTSIGGISATEAVPSMLNNVWANSVRSLLI